MFEYQLISFTRYQSSQLPDNNEWYQYIIANQFNRITGYRSGTAEEVKDYIHEIMSYQNQKLMLKHNNYEKQFVSAEPDSYI